MVKEPFAQPEYKEGIEADAVCGQCGTTNPEGTLICKTCGNNLRDQRHLRLAADQMLDAEVEGAPASSFLAKALPILGLLIVLWLGLNAGRISSMLTTASDSGRGFESAPSSEVYWQGEGHELYDGLYQELLASFPTLSDAEAARLESTEKSEFSDGVYAVYEKLGTTQRFVGAAILKFQDGEWHYVAQINGVIQLRGHASQNEHMLSADWHEGGVMYNDACYAVSGAALLNPDGVVSISGVTDLNTTQYQSAAYRIPGL